VDQKKRSLKNIEEELIYKEFLKREYTIKHLPYEREIEFYQSVQSGNLKRVKSLIVPLAGDGFGLLSKDPIRNLKYHLIISIAMITRFCIDGGMEKETAYDISDIFVNQADLCNTETEIKELHLKMIVYFTKKMKQMKQTHLYSKPVIMSLDYVYDHLQEKISLTDIASYLSLTPQYFSALFRRETGITLSKYILQKRIEAAQNMLKYSKYTASEISNYLCFSSQSHFVHCFHKYVGMTPKAYQDMFGSNISLMKVK
jgi:YesN/AraC family two-component response regulator